MSVSMMAAYACGAVATLWMAYRSFRRLQLSVAKHPSLRGHAKMARRLSRWIPFYGFSVRDMFRCDGADEGVAERRQAGFERVARSLSEATVLTREASKSLAVGLSDLQFTNHYRVPFPFREVVGRRISLPTLASRSEGHSIVDLDGNHLTDLSGAYGVNLLGYGFYKTCMRAAADEVADLGPVLGPYHPSVIDNVARLKALSGKDEVSFHMSGTEAVMQAVTLARHHTGRRYVVRFCGAYHGWWDGVQPGPGNPRRGDDVYTLRDMHEATLRVLRTRDDIACVLVNPIQGLHPNANPPSDAALVDSSRRAAFDRDAYTRWLHKVEQVCKARSIVFILDDIFTGFRLAKGGAQQYFGLDADLVTYGKTLGGGLPVGVLCGRHHLMRRFQPDSPGRVCFARGTFNSHPQVMVAMNTFLKGLDQLEEELDYAGLDGLWNERAERWNAQFASTGIPVRVANMSSVFTLYYLKPSRFNWMYQFYLRDAGVLLSWVGTGRLIFAHNTSAAAFDQIVEQFLMAARAMAADGWWADVPGLDNRAIKGQIVREVTRACWQRLTGRPTTASDEDESVQYHEHPQNQTV